MKRNFKKGITIIELILVLAVLSVVFSVVFPEFAKTRERQVLKSAAADILSSLNKARSQTMASLNSSSYGVHFDTGEIVIFKGISFSGGSADNESIGLTSPAEITNVTLAGSSGSSGSLYFERLSGDPSKTGTVTVSTPNYSKVITISATGAFSAN